MNNLFVFPIKVNNSNMPWLEFYQKGIDKEFNLQNIILIEPVIAADPLDFTDNKFCNDNQIYGNYVLGDAFHYDKTLNIVGCENAEITVTKLSIACLKNNIRQKHAHMSTYIALTDLFNHIHDYNLPMYKVPPYIMINSNYDITMTKTDSFSDMIRETTAAYLNYYHEYPMIIVTCPDNVTLFEKTGDKKKKKKKKNHKK